MRGKNNDTVNIWADIIDIIHRFPGSTIKDISKKSHRPYSTIASNMHCLLSDRWSLRHKIVKVKEGGKNRFYLELPTGRFDEGE